jgi:cytochrome b pre-mRNA-processing protein 3
LAWFRKPVSDGARAVSAAYAAIVAAARRPEFYRDLHVADSLDGRFDLLGLHAFLAMRRLKDVGNRESATFSQALFDAMFADMDAVLRQIGVSDLKVGQKVKAMAKAFLGRVEAYDAALSAADGAALRAALVRNVFRGDADGLAVTALARYMEAADALLAAQADAVVLAGGWAFPALGEFVLIDEHPIVEP